MPVAPKDAAGGDGAFVRTVPLAANKVDPDQAQANAAQATGQYPVDVALPVGYTLYEYTIEALLGTGGFGITYLARDNHLQRQVAIKEYLPNDIAVRTSGQIVRAKTKLDNLAYRAGLEGFLAEARVLASFRHPHIVRVTRFFEANKTAYMVMDYERGKPLRDWLQEHGPVEEALLLKMFLPMLDGLDVVHRAHVLHRDIKPANIYVREDDGSLVLLDFGAARYAREDSNSLTTIVTPGFAPLEQYHTHGAQGPWSDLYAFGGVLYWVVTGEKPLEAPSRVKRDVMLPALTLARGRYSERVLRAIDWALAPDEADRPKSCSQLKAVLTGEVAKPPPPISAMSGGKQGAPGAPQGGRRWPQLIGAAGVAVLAIAALAYLWKAEKPAPVPAPSVAQTPPAAAAPPAPAEAAKPAAETTKPARKAAPAGPAQSKSAAAEKKKEEAAAPTATVILDVYPRGEIVLDGRKVGTSPPLNKLSLSTGVKHKIEIHGEGLPHYWTVELKPGEERTISANFARNL